MSANTGQGTFNGATYQVNGTTSGAVQVVATAATTGTRTQTLQDASGTIALVPASISDVTVFPAWVKTTLSYTQFQAASTTNSITLLVLPAGGVIHSVKIKHSTAFAGTSITAMTVSVGVTGTLNKYASAFDVYQAVSDTTFQLSTGAGSENHGSATNILATGTSTGANLNALTQGSVDVWVLMSKAV